MEYKKLELASLGPQAAEAQGLIEAALWALFAAADVAGRDRTALAVAEKADGLVGEFRKRFVARESVPLDGLKSEVAQMSLAPREMDFQK